MQNTHTGRCACFYLQILLQEIAQQATDQLFAVFTANAVDGGFGDLHKGIVLDALFPLLGFLLFLLLLSLALGLLLLFLLGLALGLLLRLGFIGDEFKTARDVLTQRLSGATAFRFGRAA